MTHEDLQETYSEFSTQELLEIVDRKFEYTELAVTIALEEIAKRSVSEDDIKNYKEEQINKAANFIKHNIVDDLTLFQKNLFFFIWLPLVTFSFKQNFRDDGYILKLKQANYYSLLGFIFCMSTVLIAVAYDLSDLTMLAILILTFLPAYAFDEFFNRRRQVERLRRLLSKQSDVL